MHVFALQHLHALGIDDLALFVHDVVVLQDIFTDAEVAALDRLLRIFNAVGKHFGLQTGILVLAENAVDLFQSLAAEPLDQVVFQGDKEDGDARVALTAASAAELVIDTAGLVPLGTEDAQAARRDDGFLFLVRFRLILIVERIIHGAVFFALLLRFALQLAYEVASSIMSCSTPLFAHALFGEILGIAAQQDIRAAPAMLVAIVTEPRRPACATISASRS